MSKMSKLKSITDSLKKMVEDNRLVYMDSGHVSLPGPGNEGCPCRFQDGLIVYDCGSIDFKLAPKQGMYGPYELNELMKGIVPTLKPRKIEYFSWEGGMLMFGKLTFLETIGGETIPQKTVILYEPLLNEFFGFDMKRVADNVPIAKYDISIFIRPYPSEGILSHGAYEYGISKKELKQFRKLGK